MKYSDELFLLIKSMSRQEKSYFKKHASAFSESESNNYLKLFDEVVAQAAGGISYDEETLKKKDFTGKFVKNFSYHKNYLYNMILSALTSYHKESNELIPLRNLIAQSEILFDKILYDQSLKVLRRAKKMAEEKEALIYLIDILSKERILIRYVMDMDEFSVQSARIIDEQFKTVEKIMNNLEYYRLYDICGAFTIKRGTAFVRTEEELNAIDEMVMSSELLKDVNNAKTFSSKTVFYNIKIHHYLRKSDFENAYDASSKIVELWENNLDKSNGRFDNYIIALSNLLNCQIRTKRTSEFEVTEAKMENLLKKYGSKISEKNRNFIYFSLSVMGLSMSMEILEPEKLAARLSRIQEDYEPERAKFNLQQKIIFDYFMGMGYFVLSDYEKSIFWFGKIINGERTGLSEDYQCYSRIVYLISFYELGYYDSLEYALKSAYHFMSKKKKIYKYENVIQKYLRRSFRVKDDKELSEMFDEMKYELEKIYKDPFERTAFDAFNILHWLDSKREKKSIVEILKRKLNSSSQNEKTISRKKERAAK